MPPKPRRKKTVATEPVPSNTVDLAGEAREEQYDDSLPAVAQDAYTDTTTYDSNEPVVLQIMLSSTRVDELIMGEDIKSILKYNPTMTEPEAYIPNNQFISKNDILEEVDGINAYTTEKHGSTDHVNVLHKESSSSRTPHHEITCYWCCHTIIDAEYGMPIRYDACQKSFSLFGSFCSLECTAAYNYSTNMGSNRVWEIHSWIQLLGKKYGMNGVIRPAPSRYLLKMYP